MYTDDNNEKIIQEKWEDYIASFTALREEWNITPNEGKEWYLIDSEFLYDLINKSNPKNRIELI